jgi:hypothetical protein
VRRRYGHLRPSAPLLAAGSTVALAVATALVAQRSQSG